MRWLEDVKKNIRAITFKVWRQEARRGEREREREREIERERVGLSS